MLIRQPLILQHYPPTLAVTPKEPEPKCDIDRRLAIRFPIQEEVRYKVFRDNGIEVGSGKSLNMSSTGILFTTEQPLSPGERLEVAVNWSVRLKRTPLQLVIFGVVIRCEDGRAAVAIERYEFRTHSVRGNRTAAVLAAPGNEAYPKTRLGRP